MDILHEQCRTNYSWNLGEAGKLLQFCLWSVLLFCLWPALRVLEDDKKEFCIIVH